MIDTPTQGIEGLLKSQRNLGLNDVIRIHHQLTKTYPLPKVSIINKQDCKPESRLLLNIDGYPTPALNVFKGKLETPDQQILDYPIYASFRTSKHVKILPLSKAETTQYLVKIPENALNGLLGIIFPVEESFGPPDVVKNYSRDITEWIIQSNHIQGTNNIEEYCPHPEQPSISVRYLATTVPEPFNFHFSITCSVCPYGAIKVMPTYCYVDPSVCRGQKYTHPNSDATQEVCWQCLLFGDDTVSSRCDAITMRKVLHLNPDAPKKEVPCCGAPYGLFPACTRGAVKKDPINHFWYVDKLLCNGCAECYHAFSCSWNCGRNCTPDCPQSDSCANMPLPDGEGGYYYRDIRPNYTIRMVAHIDTRLTLHLAKIERRPWDEPLYVPWKPPFNEEDDVNKFDLIIWADKKHTIPINLGKRGVHTFRGKPIPFMQRVHLGLFQNDKLFGYQFCGSNLPIRSIGGKRYDDPTQLLQGGSLLFNSPIGSLQLDYSITK